MVVNLKALILATSFIATIGYIAALYAQQIAVEILDEVTVTQNNFNSVVKIKFKQPVRYISHNPSNRAQTLNINIELLGTLNSFNSSPQNESLSLDPDTGITEVSFETLSRNSNYIIVYFNKEVSFEIIQGSDHRSLSIVMYGQ